MIKHSLLFSIIFCTINCVAQTKLPTDLGNGSVKIGLFWFPPADTAKMDTAGHMVMQFDYHILHDKVLRSKNAERPLASNSSRENSTGSDTTVKSSLAVSLITPHYLIDWKKKLVYTFFTKNKKPFISKDSLRTDSDELFFRALLLAIISKRTTIIDTAHQQPITVAGLPCYKALYKSSDQVQWHQFIYTKQQLPIFSLLNAYLNFNFSFTVVSFDAESTSAFNNYSITCISRIQLLSFDTETPDPNIFQLPKGVPVLKSVPHLSMY
ncbi:hypothetical protein [Mucilaginibacter kameinonensis]|uniref:hypothetical protein n=1 Tax=Mucilaginibacter kameinonensis TaxID=452286 RepID=UPI000EF79C05|nr:hypothetical protein [Mucilaginibacter kameinonensis]